MVDEHDNHYALLQVDPAAEPGVIESAYRRLARKYHPDVNRSAEASAMMRALNLAYATLSNPSRRAIYDRQLRQTGIRQRLSANSIPRQVAATSGPAAPPPAQVGGLRPASLRDYRRASEPLKERAAASMRRWSAEWASCVDAVVLGDPRARLRAGEAGQRCVAELGECLSEWESLAPPGAARRLGDLGAACLKLELALVRGTLSFTEHADFSVLQPLAGLAERIADLTRTIAAETTLVRRAELAAIR